MTANESPVPFGDEEPGRAALFERANARELVQAVATNLARLRHNSGIDVGELAEMSSLPREQLVALESGRATPSLRGLWALADAFGIPFGVLISGAPCAMTSFHVLRAATTTTVASTGGGFRTRALSAAGDPREPEVYEVTLAPGWVEAAAAHGPRHVRAHRRRPWRARRTRGRPGSDARAG